MIKHLNHLHPTLKHKVEVQAFAESDLELVLRSCHQVLL